jgi:hypothetical protein
MHEHKDKDDERCKRGTASRYDHVETVEGGILQKRHGGIWLDKGVRKFPDWS